MGMGLGSQRRAGFVTGRRSRALLLDGKKNWVDDLCRTRGPEIKPWELNNDRHFPRSADESNVSLCCCERSCVGFLGLGLEPLPGPRPLRKDKDLHIYFVDVEGGQATLFVTPAGQSLLIDTGWPGNDGRDADRIVAAASKAGSARSTTF